MPFLAFPPEVRRVIYTTNLIESMNARLRKVTRNRGQFPSEQAVLKVLYLAVRNLEEYRRPNVGIRSSGWKQALQAFTIYFEGRIPTPCTATITYTDGRTLPPTTRVRGSSVCGVGVVFRAGVLAGARWAGSSCWGRGSVRGVVRRWRR